MFQKSALALQSETVLMHLGLVLLQQHISLKGGCVWVEGVVSGISPPTSNVSVDQANMHEGVLAGD